MTIPFERISETEWEALPGKAKAKGPSTWDPLLDELAGGQIIRLRVEGDKQARGYRIGLARRAATRGMKLEFRLHEGQLAVRKSSEPYRLKAGPSPVTGSTARRGRRPKASGEGQE